MVSFSKRVLPVARVQTLSAAGGRAEQRTKGGHSAWATLDPGCGQCLGSCALLTLSRPDLSRISTHRPCKETPQSKLIKRRIIMGRVNFDSLQNMEKVKQTVVLFKTNCSAFKGEQIVNFASSHQYVSIKALFQESCQTYLRTKHIKGSKERYLLGQNTTCKNLGYSPLSNYKTTLKQQ